MTWKHKSWHGILVHALIYFAVGAVILLPWLAQPVVLGFLIFNAALHFAIDRSKILHEKNGHRLVRLFFVDQTVHVLILALGAWWIGSELPASAWVGSATGAAGGFGNFWLTGYLIPAIILTYCYEIVKYQFAREENPHARMKLNCRKMFVRLLIFSVLYGIFASMASFEVAKTLQMVGQG